MTSYELAQLRSRADVELAMRRFRLRPTESNLARVIRAFNNRPTDRRALPRIQGWQIVEN